MGGLEEEQLSLDNPLSGSCKETSLNLVSLILKGVQRDLKHYSLVTDGG